MMKLTKEYATTIIIIWATDPKKLESENGSANVTVKDAVKHPTVTISLCP